MLQKIIAIGIGLIMAIATITGCGFIEDKISETEEDQEKSYICTTYETYSDEYECKFAFTNTGDDDNQFRKDVSDIQYYYLDNGYRVSSIMWTDDWSQAFMWVYSDESVPIDVVYK